MGQRSSIEGGRRGWLVASGVAMVAIVMAVVLLSRGGGDNGDGGMAGMPGMDMGGGDASADLVMPPGMAMDGMSMEAMAGMAAIDADEVDAVADPDARGDQALEPELDGTTKTFRLTASVVRWTILPGVEVTGFAYNEQIPGPRLQLAQGDRVRIVEGNDLPEPTTVHWHGLVVPNEMDGPADVTQDPILPGDDFTYEFTAGQSGTFFYHTHHDPDRQQGLGLYGALIVDPASPGKEPQADLEHVMQMQEWLKREWLTYPAMQMEGALPNFFTINGKAYPETETIRMRVGQTIKIRFIGSHTMSIHPMHIHGGPFTVVAVDGETLAPTARYDADTVNVGPGQRFDVIWKARRPGKWLVHCHIPHHTKNNNVEVQGGGGLTAILLVEE